MKALSLSVVFAVFAGVAMATSTPVTGSDVKPAEVLTTTMAPVAVSQATTLPKKDPGAVPTSAAGTAQVCDPDTPKAACVPVAEG